MSHNEASSETSRDVPSGREPVTGTTRAESATVFISYSRRDSIFVDRLDAALRSRGVATFIDRTSIGIGEDWFARLKDLISRAETIIFVLSPDSIDSEVCFKEVEYGKSLGKRLIPVVARRVDTPNVPAVLSSLNYLFLDDEETYDRNIDRLVAAIRTDLGWVRRHADLARSAEEWRLSGRPRGFLLGGPRLSAAEAWLANRPADAPLATDDTRALIAASRRAVGVRRNRWIAALSLGLVIAIGLAAYFWSLQQEAIAQRAIATDQKNDADRQRTVAEASLESARKAAEGLVVTIGQDLRGRGLSTSALSAILKRAETLIDDIVLSAPTNVMIRRSQATMYAVFADNFAVAGDLEKMELYSERSVTIVRSIYNTHKDDALSAWEYASALNYAAIAHIQLEEPTTAMAYFKKSQDVLLQRADKEMRPRRGLFEALSGVADCLVKLRRFDEALRAYFEALPVLSDVIADNARNKDLLKLKAIALYQIASVYDEIGKYEDARRFLNGSGDIFDELTKQEPDNSEFSYSLIRVMFRLGTVLEKLGYGSSAIHNMNETLIPKVRKLYEYDTSNDDYYQLYIKILSNVSNYKTGNELTALLEEIVKARTFFAVNRAQDEDALTDLILSLDKLGTQLTIMKNFSKALEAFETAMKYIRKLDGMSKDKENTARMMAIALYKSGSLYVVTNNRVEGCDSMSQALAMIAEYQTASSSTKLDDLLHLIYEKARNKCPALVVERP